MPDNKEARRKAAKQAEVDLMFSRDIATKYENECKRQGTEPSFDGLIQFAIRHGVVRQTDINRYLTIALYPKALWERNGRRSAAVQDLEETIGVSDRLIWSWLKDLSGRYLHYRKGNK
jgi:hypothetical protein